MANKHLAYPLSDSLLKETVDYHWPLLQTALADIPATAMAAQVKRPDRELLEELVELARGKPQELPPWFRDQTHLLLILEPENRPKLPAIAEAFLKTSGVMSIGPVQDEPSGALAVVVRVRSAEAGLSGPLHKKLSDIIRSFGVHWGNLPPGGGPPAIY